jgi:hypothetical protein
LRTFTCRRAWRHEATRQGLQRVDSGGGETVRQGRPDPALLTVLARTFRYQRLLDEGRYASIGEMAEAERIERGYLGTLLRLTLLAPDIVEAILDGRQPQGVTLPRLLEPVSVGWAAQSDALGSR